MVSKVEVIPSARRLTTSLRDIGYDVPQAVADLVDNSISARAKNVRIDFKFLGEASWARIVDDGSGIATSRLNEAMRYGSERDYDSGDLGRFGLGLKTASLSQCRVLTVATRVSKGQRRYEIRRWDLNEVERTNRWNLLRLSPNECPEYLLQPLEAGTGTVVLWQEMDRVLGYKQPSGGHARRGFESMCRGVEDHLAMVFHRFLSKEGQRRSLKLYINGNPVEPWDPFARSERATRALAARDLIVARGGDSLRVHIQPYVLPAQAQFSSPASFNRSSGPRKWNRQQGFYIYRENRLIQSGGWNRLRTQDEHTKLARISVDIERDLDEAFGVNVSKMRVGIPEELREELGDLAAMTAAQAKAAYSGRSAAGNTAKGGPPRRGDGRTGSASLSLTRIEKIVRRVLRSHPRLLQKILDEFSREVRR